MEAYLTPLMNEEEYETPEDAVIPSAAAQSLRGEVEGPALLPSITKRTLADAPAFNRQ